MVFRLVVKGPQDLQKEILDRKLCSSCGVCVTLCPYIDLVAGKAVIIEPCGLAEGKCYSFCPRTDLDIPALDKHVFESPRSDPVLGSHVTILKARARDAEIKSAAQYGGVVSALMTYALEIGEIDVAVLAGSIRGEITPKPTLAMNPKEVLRCAGSKYIVCPVPAEALKALRQVDGRIGVVGTPCQVAAIRKIQASGLEPEIDKIKMILGLFCTWALTPQAYNYIRNLVNPLQITKLDVPPPPSDILVIETEEEHVEVPLDAIDEYIMPACRLCFDMTNEFADISIGAVEGEAEWNTVIVRTGLGEKFFQRANEMGIVEIRPLEQERVNHMYEASLNRKKRVLMEMESRKISYLSIREEDRSKILL